MPATMLPGVETTKETQGVLTPLFHCVLLDDDEHSYDYVVEMLQKLFLLSTDAAFRHAVEVDSCGRTIIITAELPVANFAKEQIQGYGADYRIPKCKGSMTAIVEPAAGGTPA
ncbi:MAG: ATP-dependent Clp protease adaptor ClpS [Candidatus Solibacter usitatus]|nr:ATP-dependent Clp protease adaptor ClpS [Candidatus Solibacter usitatus]